MFNTKKYIHASIMCISASMLLFVIMITALGILNVVQLVVFSSALTTVCILTKYNYEGKLISYKNETLEEKAIFYISICVLIVSIVLAIME